MLEVLQEFCTMLAEGSGKALKDTLWLTGGRFHSMMGVERKNTSAFLKRKNANLQV